MKIRFDSSPDAAQQSNGLGVRYASAKRRVPRWRWYLLLVLLLTPLLYMAYRLAMAQWFETAPGLVQLDHAVIKSSASGRLRPLVNLGDATDMAQAIARIEPVQLTSPTPPAGSASAAAPKLRPVAPVQPAVPPGLSAADRAERARAYHRERAALQSLRLVEQQLALRQERLAVMNSLKKEEAATRQDVDLARQQLMDAQLSLVRARLDLAEARARPVSTVATAAPAAAIELELAAAPTAAELAAAAPRPEITSTLKGRVVRWLVPAGEWVSPGTEVAVLHGPTEPRVVAFLDPARIRYAEVGRKAVLLFRDGARVDATVVAVAPETQRLPADLVNPLAPRGPVLVVTLRPDAPLSEAHRVHELPLDVRFNFVW